MNEEFVRSDDDLMKPLLCSTAYELSLIVEMMRKAKSCFLNEYCLDPLLIADEFQKLGGNSIMNIRGHGIGYKEIVYDVADNIGVTVEKDNCVSHMEWLIIEHIIKKLIKALKKKDRKAFEEEIRKRIRSISDKDSWQILRDHTKNHDVRLWLISLIIDEISKGDKLHKSSSLTTKMGVIGTVVGIPLGGALGAAIGAAVGSVLGGMLKVTIHGPGPAYKATVPAVFVVAYIRERILAEGVKVDYVKDPALRTATGRELEIVKKVEYFMYPDFYIDAASIIKNKKLVPTEKGIYGWYFNSIPPKIPLKDYFEVDGRTLLYIGIAGRRGGGELRTRIHDQHINGNAYGSTLRFSLGCLLSNSLGIQMQKKGGKGFWFGKTGEQKLTEWLTLHASVAFLVDDVPIDVEQTIFESYGELLPLNLDENTRNPFYSELERIRKIYKNMIYDT